MTPSDSTVRAAYARCRRLARRHYENFPVASYLVPGDKRDPLAVIYAFARTADDFADEAGGGPIPDEIETGHESRLQRLADWRRKLNECYVGEGFSLPREPGRLPDPATRAIFIALGDTVRRFQLSHEHFDNLLRAFELDVTVNRHRDFSSLLAYCSCSANPVGRLVLELFGQRDPELSSLSDNLCTGLQLANFWQDVALDLRKGRVYLPLEDLASFGYSLDDLREERVNERQTQLMTFEVGRTREFFERSKLLPERVLPSLRRQLRLTWLGGATILRKIEAAGYDVFRQRPKLGRWDWVRLWLRARSPLGSRPGDAEDRAPTIVSRP